MLMRQDLSVSPGKRPSTLEKLDTHLRLSFLPEKPQASTALLGGPGGGTMGPERWATLSLLMWSRPVSVVLWFGVI